MPALFAQDETKLDRTNHAMISPQILIVDDEPQLRNLLAEILSESFYEVAIATDGVEALELLKAYPSIQLILSDVLMPRMNGYELVERALGFRPELKVLIMTAYAAEMPPPALLLAREIRTLHKPFDVVELCELAEGMLSRP
jgi:CheY-like chemotaxis protein